jgi:hypothetical protein
MKSELVLGRVVGGLSDVILEAGAIGGQVDRAGNGFGGRVLFIREEGKAAAGGFDVIRKAGNERADFCLEMDVGNSVGGFLFVLRELGIDTIVIFVESLFAVTIDVQGFSIGWNFVRIGFDVGGDGNFRALRRVGNHAVGDFADAGGAGDSLYVFLRGGVDIHRRSELFLGNLREDERASALADHGWLGVAIVAGRRGGLVVRHGTWLNVGTGNRNFSEVVYRDKVEAGGRQSKFKICTSGSRLELKV